MRKNWLLIAIGLLAAVLAIGAVACGDDDEDNGDGNGPTATAGAPADGEPTDGEVLRLFAHLTEVDGSGASGEADLSVNGEGILVSLAMEGLTEGAHANHLHAGSCEALGAIVVPLDDIVADETGTGTQTTASDAEPLSTFEIGHYLAVHEGDSATVGAVVACGDVVAE